ncbi:signal peptidase II [uncultured Nocardioides sp.]|uniref:Lipoprotein signal peptidase n=1 Tax=uncultured Nocardioides sp. TaxID=198441 RepID=A0A6J4P0F9_9ACTN|nr:signal peptidase II [uncultured Nocardioides sp.]CAA9402397.1 MAG: Lipoprotein signal peptidase [uncultured Nocardioides sp.]
MQATGGASLNASDHDEFPPSTDPAAPGRRAWWLFPLTALVAYAIDLATKTWAVEALSGGRDRQVVDGVLTFHLTFNPGAAFSTGTEYTVALSCLAILAVCLVLFFSVRVRDAGWAVALGLLLAGVGGNLTDRLFREPGPMRGHVVDFLQLPNWPVFNVADICINVAAGLIILQTFRGIALDGTRDRDRDASGDEVAS